MVSAGGFFAVFCVWSTAPVFAICFYVVFGSGIVAVSTCFFYYVGGVVSFIVAMTSAYVTLSGVYICVGIFPANDLYTGPVFVAIATYFAIRVRGPGA